MHHATPDQLRKALALIKATAAHDRRITLLGDLIKAAKAVAAAKTRARAEAVNFYGNPDLLANLMNLAQSPDAQLRQSAQWAYHNLLSDMIKPPMGGPPLRVDFDALAPAARPALLGPFLAFTVGGIYPRLCPKRSSLEAGSLTYVVTSGAANADHLTPHLPAISAWLGGDWHLEATTSTTFTLIRRPALPPNIPLNPAWLKTGHLMLGIDAATHQPFQLPLERMTHMLIAGTPGMGKSVFLHTFLRSCFHSLDRFAHIHLACGQGVAFERYRGCHPKVTVTNEPDDLHNLAADLQTTMKERTARLVAEQRDKMGDYILVLVDEWGAFNQPETTDKAGKEAHARFLQNIMHLGKRGRKVGIRLVLVVQEPVERDLAPGVRAALASVISFRLPLTVHATALFGEITPPAVPADPRTLPIGRAIYHDGQTSTRTLLHIPFTPPPGGRR